MCKLILSTESDHTKQWFGLWCLTGTFNNISVISWQLVLLMEKTGVPGENHQPVTSDFSD